MKILQICVEGNRGSTGIMAENIGKHLISLDNKSYIAHARFFRESESQIIKIGNFYDVLSHVFLTRVSDRHCFGSKKATKKLITEIKRINPDLIHLHHLHGYYVNIEILFSFLKEFKKPVVWTFHDCWSFTGHCAHFDFVGCSKWMTQCYECPQIREYPTSFFDRSRQNYIDKKKIFNSLENLTIVSVSTWLQNLVKQSFLSSLPNLVIHNGINLDIFKPVSSQFKDKYELKNKIVLMSSATSWSYKKGFNDLLRLSEILPKHYTIVIIGLSNSQIRSLPRNILGLPITENVSSLVEAYSSADIYLNLSYEETFGLTMIESMACGTPVIAYNCTSSPEIVNNEVGLLSKKGSIESLKDNIKKLESKLSKQLSDNCRDYVKKNYSAEKQLNSYSDLYYSLIYERK